MIGSSSLIGDYSIMDSNMDVASARSIKLEPSPSLNRGLAARTINNPISSSKLGELTLNDGESSRQAIKSQELEI